MQQLTAEQIARGKEVGKKVQLLFDVSSLAFQGFYLLPPKGKKVVVGTSIAAATAVALMKMYERSDKAQAIVVNAKKAVLGPVSRVTHRALRAKAEYDLLRSVNGRIKPMSDMELAQFDMELADIGSEGSED